MIKGFANKGGTSSYFNKFNEILSRETTWFSVSPIAIGTHLGEMTDSDSLLYRDSIDYSLKNGINFVDTAINYRGMKSERDVGSVLTNLINNSGVVKREEIVVSTKAGIIPGDVDKGLIPLAYLNQILLKDEIIREADLNIVETHRHVLAPSYFDFAIGESRKHLNLDTIDIYYLHNPEISMMVLGPDLFYEKLVRLFTFFEEQVEKGIIKHYGMATWDAFLYEPHQSGYISLDRVLEVARSVAGESHHFHFIQLPFNKAKPWAGSKKNQLIQGKYVTLFEAAQQLGVYVTTSAPFNLGKSLNEGISAKDILMENLHNKNILSTMVGMKNINHVQKNIKTLVEDC